MPKHILLVPAYNEAGTIVDVMNRAERFVDLIVIVNDGSTDGTDRLIRGWAGRRPYVTVLTLARNSGYSAALLTGLAYVGRLLSDGEIADDDVIINIDADGQHVPEEIPVALAAMRADGADMLLGQRDFSVYPWVKVIGNRLFTHWVSLLSGHRYTDVECGFRLVRAAVLPDLLRYCTGRKYSLTDEIGIVVPRRGWRVTNKFPTQVPYYRARARLIDGITNFYMGLLTMLRLLLRRQQQWPGRIERVLQGVVHEQEGEFQADGHCVSSRWATP